MVDMRVNGVDRQRPMSRRQWALGTAACLLNASPRQASSSRPLALPADAPSDPFPRLASAYQLALNGHIIWQRNAHVRLPPASLTKLMTALLAVESGNLDAPVAISADAARETGSRLKLRAGQVLRAHDLLCATLVASANDACHALSEHIAGTQAACVTRMNVRAAALGLRNTHFANACGHDAPGHVSSASDLALLARSVMQHSTLRALAALPRARIQTLNGDATFELRASNALLGRYAYATGLKTGTTRQAGACLVATARKGMDDVLLVLLHGKDRWWDAVDLMELAFART